MNGEHAASSTVEVVRKSEGDDAPRCARCLCPIESTLSQCPRCGVSLIPPRDASALIDGRYEVLREIAHGAMGVVFEARDIALGRAVALKLVAPHLTEKREVIDRFRREAAALAAVRSAHVVQVHAFGEHDGGSFFVMDYVAGRDLETIITEHNDHHTWVPLATALTILHQVAAGLSSVHAAGLVHRDVKPANIVVEATSGRAMLIDFGLARWVEVEPDKRRRTLGGGTPWYMPPEQAADEVATEMLTPAADVYALACTGFELLAGRPPFESSQPWTVILRHLHETPPALSSVRPELAALDHVFARALAKDPRDRYADAGAFAEALRSATSGLAVPRPVSAPPPREELKAATEPLRVLIVDDDDAFRRFAMRASQLALFGRQVRLAAVSSGVAALENARRKSPDLVLLDYDMPGLDGIETLSHLRALPGGNRARIVVLSGKLTDDDRWRFAALGVSDFLAKPLSLSDLVSRLGGIATESRWQP